MDAGARKLEIGERGSAEVFLQRSGHDNCLNLYHDLRAVNAAFARLAVGRIPL
jgi:hypothetical protein